MVGGADVKYKRLIAVLMIICLMFTQVTVAYADGLDAITKLGTARVTQAILAGLTWVGVKTLSEQAPYIIANKFSDWCDENDYSPTIPYVTADNGLMALEMTADTLSKLNAFKSYLNGQTTIDNTLYLGEFFIAEDNIYGSLLAGAGCKENAQIRNIVTNCEDGIYKVTLVHNIYTNTSTNRNYYLNLCFSANSSLYRSYCYGETGNGSGAIPSSVITGYEGQLTRTCYFRKVDESINFLYQDGTPQTGAFAISSLTKIGICMAFGSLATGSQETYGDISICIDRVGSIANGTGFVCDESISRTMAQEEAMKLIYYKEIARTGNWPLYPQAGVGEDPEAVIDALDQADIPDNPVDDPTNPSIPIDYTNMWTALWGWLQNIINAILSVPGNIIAKLEEVRQAILGITGTASDVTNYDSVITKVKSKFAITRLTQSWTMLQNMDTSRGDPPVFKLNVDKLMEATSPISGVSTLGIGELEFWDVSDLQQYQFLGYPLVDLFRTLIGIGCVIATFMYCWRKVTPTHILGGEM